MGLGTELPALAFSKISKPPMKNNLQISIQETGIRYQVSMELDYF